MIVGLAKVMIFRIRSACSIASNSNVDIDGCSFSGISHTNNGGVVYSSGDYMIKVKNTMFFNISAGKGGAIYHESNGYCNVSNVCGSNLRALNNYHFALVKLNNANAVNGFQMASFTYCSRNSEGSFTVLFQYGHQAFLNCNASENKALNDGVVKFEEFQSLDAGFCTFYGNYYSNTNHLFIKTSSSSSFRKSNFISNNGGLSKFVAQFEGNSPKSFIECIFRGNTGYLFSVSGGVLTLTSCVIDHVGFSPSASIITSSCIFTSTPSYSLNHLITYYCPFIPTPAPSPIETPPITPPASFHPTPPSSFEPTPQQTPNSTPEQSYEPTSQQTPNSTPEQSYEPTSQQTPNSTPEQSYEPTSQQTPNLTPEQSYEPTPQQTPNSTPEQSHEPTPQQTPNLTPEQSYESTPKMTNPRSFDYNCQASSLNSQTGKIAVSTVFCFVFLQ